MVLPEAPNRRWSFRFVSDAVNRGRRFCVLKVVDVFIREWLAPMINTRIRPRD